MGNAILLAASSSSWSVSLVPLYYGITIVGLILAGLWAVKKYSDRQKREFIRSGNEEQKLSDKLESNTKAADKNTASIEKLGEKFEKLGEKFDSFSANVDKRMTLADYRIEKLEEHMNGHAPKRGA